MEMEHAAMRMLDESKDNQNTMRCIDLTVGIEILNTLKNYVQEMGTHLSPIQVPKNT